MKYFLDIRDCAGISFNKLRSLTWVNLDGIIISDKMSTNDNIIDIMKELKGNDKKVICQLTTKDDIQIEDIVKHLNQNTSKVRLMLNQDKFRTSASIKKLRKFIVTLDSEIIYSDEIQDLTYKEYLDVLKDLPWVNILANMPRPYIELKKGRPLILKNNISYLTLPNITADRFLLFSIAAKYKSEISKIRSKGHNPKLVFKLDTNMLVENDANKIITIINSIIK